MLQAHPGTAANTWSSLLRAGREDRIGGLGFWRIWWLVAVGDIRQRYQRSLLGQFWLTISMGVTIGAIGFVYSVLFQQDMATYLPFLGVGIVCWGLISGIVTDGCGAFRLSAAIIVQSRLPRSWFVYPILLLNLICFDHTLF